MDINAFWKPWEVEITSFANALEYIHDVFERWSANGARFAWRGQVDASWGLHSSLYRRAMWTIGKPLDESELADEEHKTLVEAHRWGLHTGVHGRLSVMSQLAVLQHYGAPTRLVDVTFNPLIGLWFAVEQQWKNGKPAYDDVDGRLFAVDVADSLINEDDDRREWEDDGHTPWPQATALPAYEDWTTKVRAWRPARLDHRIAAQNGGFLFGGVPPSKHQHPKGTAVKDGKWPSGQARQALSLPLRVHKLVKTAGRKPNNPAYTMRIKAAAKQKIRDHLQELYGYRPATIYPDYPGFSLFGRPELKSNPA